MPLERCSDTRFEHIVALLLVRTLDADSILEFVHKDVSWQDSDDVREQIILLVYLSNDS